MAERTNRRILKKLSSESQDEIEFSLQGMDPASSPVRPVDVETETVDGEIGDLAGDRNAKNLSPEFLELAEPKLPNLAKTYRARLLMQSPTRLYFYWDAGKNPFHVLSRAIGESRNYVLVLKLVNLRNGAEEVHPVDPAGTWWFSVSADSAYRAEIGFYAVNRPYVRVLHSNVVSTPRKSPSPRTAERAEWRVPAEKFARVLDAAGFARDAFDVAFAGDDVRSADEASRAAFAEFSGRRDGEIRDFEAEEMRYVMLALASGVQLSELRGLISESLFGFLSGLSELSGERALTALGSRFDFQADEFDLEEETGPAVYGASLVNFPRKIKKVPRGLTPVSSLRPVSSSTRPL